ncbi:hypothetical protein TKK_0005919 [Trichogramma kaykai]
MIIRLRIALILIWLCMITITSSKNETQSYSFTVDYANDQFLLDGKPFRYVAGSFHYFRTPRQNWRDILRKMRVAGLNAVSTYVEWSTHEPEPNQWVWSGDADIEEFIKIAAQEGLFVILRPGPYICAERDFGGFPYWLLKVVPDIKIRTKDERYNFYAERYIHELFKRVGRYLRGYGGPIIMVQVENEYGSFYSCDDVYKKKMFDLFNYHVKNNALLFTTDGTARRMLQCGTIPGVYSTIDFAAGSNLNYSIKMMRQYSPKGPLVNSEYYTGWLTHWNETFQRTDADYVAAYLDEMLARNFSVNFYMFIGGTNFGFTSGANINEFYWPQLTSYDYDAPLTEAGDPTPKYFKIRSVISKYLPLPNVAIPTIAPKGNYGVVTLIPALDLFTSESVNLFGSVEAVFEKPPSFEALGLSNWLVQYETSIPLLRNPNNLTLEARVKDRALVYANGKLSGVLTRMTNKYVMNLPKGSKKIRLLTENLGRVNYGSNEPEDFKGISNVKLNNVTLGPWKVVGFRLSSLKNNDFLLTKTRKQTGKLFDGPQFLVGYFNVEGEPLDTYLNTVGWGKGAVYVNGYNLGRYWPSVGPQVTLYVPAAFLRKGQNSVVVLELEYVPQNRIMKLQGSPILDYSLELAKDHYNNKVWVIS